MIPLTGLGSLFQRIGSIGGIFNLINQNRGTVIPPKIINLQSEYVSTDQATIDGIYTTLLSYQNSETSFQQSMRSLAQQTVVQMANDDQPQTSSTSLPVAMSYLI